MKRRRTQFNARWWLAASYSVAAVGAGAHWFLDYRPSWEMPVFWVGFAAMIVCSILWALED